MPMLKSSKPRKISCNWDELLKLIPGYDPKATAGDCVFVPELAQRVVDFFAACLSHVKGELAGRPFKLEPWQQAILGCAFGWLRPDGTRRYREVLIFVPRKNGKSLLAAGICNYMLFCDGEAGAEIYCAAAERDQAALVFDVAKYQVLNEPTLAKVATVYQKAICLKNGASSLRAISADANTKHGYNSHCVVVDELHAQNSRELVDVLLTSTGSRRQPLVVYITTSDYDRESICNEKYNYAAKVRDGIIQDASFLPVIYEASKDDDWTSPEVWKKANPNIDVSISTEYLARECDRAKETPTYENTFKRLHLNIRTEQDVRWIPIEKWDACNAEVDQEELEGRECFAGLDLSTTTDISALALVFRGDDNSIDVIPHFWIPAENAQERERRDRVPYVTWARQGLVHMTPGNVIDYEYIREELKKLGDQFKIKEIAIDPWNAQQLAAELTSDGFQIVQFRQGFASMSGPTKELEKIILGKTLHHGGNPVLRWMASNCAVELDAAGNIKVSKKKSMERIDGIVALIMAIGRATLNMEIPSVYDERGLLTL
jgi:phage terminase large subunit-like protein